MVMETVQIRLGEGLIKMIDNLVATGVYSSRSDVIRNAVRDHVLKQQFNDALSNVRFLTPKESKKVSKEMKEYQKKHGLQALNKKLRNDFGLE